MPADSIGLTIAKRRGLLDLSQEELAARVGVTRDTVSKWETGAFLPRKSRLGRLEQVLGISLTDDQDAAAERDRERLHISIDRASGAELAKLVKAWDTITENGTSPQQEGSG